MAVASIAFTLRIRSIRQFVPSLGAICSILSAAPKNIGPLISYTRVFLGTVRREILSGSLSSSMYFQPCICVTSLIRFINRSAAAIIPTSMATTRSNTTVSTRVATSTIISLFGEVRHSATNSRHSDILYATIKRIAAIAGIGINAA